MAGERSLPGIGLTGFWSLGDNTWKPGMDLNLRRLSALVQLSVLSRVTALPASPADGEIYIVPTGAASNAEQIAIRDNGAWVYVVPAEGWLGYVKDEDLYVKFNGATWEVLATGGGGGSAIPILSGFVGGKMLGNETIFRFVAPLSMTLKAVNVRANASVAATASSSLDVQKNGVSAGSITFAAAATTGAATFGADIALAAGDTLSIIAPATPDTTLADVAFTLQGE